MTSTVVAEVQFHRPANWIREINLVFIPGCNEGDGGISKVLPSPVYFRKDPPSPPLPAFSGSVLTLLTTGTPSQQPSAGAAISPSPQRLHWLSPQG
ncbi:unnamed protein product [Boreogadus saida]